MKEQIEVTAMVIAQAPIGEYDRRIVLLTLEKGKISAFARGARRPNNHLLGACQPMTFGKFHLYAGKNSYNLLSAEIENYFPGVKADLKKVSYGTYFLELAAYLTRENNDEREILKLLYQSLRALERGKMPEKLIRCVYEIRILTCFGEGMQVFSCIKCGREEGLTHYSVNLRGCLCSNCMRQISDKIRLSDSTLYTLQYIIVTPLEKLYNFLVSEEVFSEIQKISKKYLRQHVKEDFKSLEMIEIMDFSE
ncbi:MAG: DNA repair protein RecO [Lachnospiraceae bacterium]|nr:DNA repair protein RecO [Lachnospiraceae bacterium]